MERELQDEVVLDLPALLALCLRKGIWILFCDRTLRPGTSFCKAV